MLETLPFHVRESMTKVAPHHESVEALWLTKWRTPCSRGIYPFVDCKLEDFDPIFDELIKQKLVEPYDPDTLAAPFFHPAKALTEQALNAERSGNVVLASELYLRAAGVYRMARFPVARSPKTFEAWELGKEAYLKGSRYLNPANIEITIPHTHRIDSEGPEIKCYLRVPEHASPTQQVPIVIFICGLDAYRTDHTNRTSEHVKRGFACLSVEIPGTGDSPALKNDPLSPERQWSSVLDWIQEQEMFDRKMICVRGVSTGGYYAMRIAHTHADRLLAVVSQGGGSHRMFSSEWINVQNNMEYPYALVDALMYKFGYDSVDEYKRTGKERFSFLENGIFDNPSCRLLLVNGMQDEILPIEDSIIPLEYGNVKEARFVQGAYHMGNPAGERIIYDWLDQFK